MSESLVPSDLPQTKEELLQKLRSLPSVTAEPGMYSSFESWCDDDGSFNPALLAADIAANYEIKTDEETDILYLYDYDQGVYDRHGDTRLRTVINNCLKKQNREHRTRETIFLVHSQTLEKLPISLYLACENGLLNPKTKTLKDFTSSEFCTIKIPVRYDPKADCLAIKKFLSEIMESDQIPIIQEFFGYTLLRDMPIHKAIILHGPGRNGKSTLLRLIIAWLGQDNCSTLTLQQLFDDKFAAAELFG